MTETGINTAGEALDWVAALAYGGRGGRPRPGDYERLDREAAGVPPGADGLLFVPVLGDGERDDPALRGTATGLSLRHGRAAWATGDHGGGRVRHAGPARGARPGPGTGRRAAGLRAGRPACARWDQIKADVLGVPVLRVPGDATAAGVAMLAGIGAGVYSGPDEAVTAACHPEEPVLPDPAAPGCTRPRTAGTGRCWPPTWPASGPPGG